MNEQEQNQLVRALTRSREQFKRMPHTTPEQAVRQRQSQRDRDIMDLFRNR